MILLKLILIKFCVDSLGLGVSSNTEIVKVQSTSEYTDTIEISTKIRPLGDFYPTTTRLDSTALAILDGKIIPFKEGINLCFIENKTKVDNQCDPFDAIYEFGIIGLKGVIVFTTKKSE
jgi:hypothetical protein